MSLSSININPFNSKKYWSNPYESNYKSQILHHIETDGLVLDQSIFYPEGGGQPGDKGCLVSDHASADVIATEMNADGLVVIRIAGSHDIFPLGTIVEQTIDWTQRYKYMRLHTALHLLTVALPYPVTGGQIAADKGRLDFNMPALTEEKSALENRINELVSRKLAVTSEWITDEIFSAHRNLVKTQQVQPPVVNGLIRLVRIGSFQETIDLQPCGGTHVANTSEIGRIRISKIENKGRNNRRVILSLDE